MPHNPADARPIRDWFQMGKRTDPKVPIVVPREAPSDQQEFLTLSRTSKETGQLCGWVGYSVGELLVFARPLSLFSREAIESTASLGIGLIVTFCSDWGLLDLPSQLESG